MNYRKIAKELHESVNHTYDGYNYILHLDAVNAVKMEFNDELINDLKHYLSLKEIEFLHSDIIYASIYFHDVEEDCRLTYNNIKEIIGEFAANIVHAVTNEKGRNRAERASDSYYKGIRETPGASFVKMCDRIANVRYSRMMGSSMFEKYQKENQEFMEKVEADRFPRMSKCLINLFK